MKNKIVGKYIDELIAIVHDDEIKKTKLYLFVDGKELKPSASQKVWNHSPDGFNAGYGGSGPAQSALAILLHVLKDKTRAIRLHQDFKFEFLAKPKYQTDDFEFEVNIVAWANLKELGY